MSQNKIPLSVRISQSDADFIAKYEINDARTPSEKLRALLTEVRLDYELSSDYIQILHKIQKILAPKHNTVLQWEAEQQIYSVFLHRLFEMLPDLVAYLATSCPEKATPENMKDYEAGAVVRLCRLLESVLQLSVSNKHSFYDKTVIDDNIENSLQLLKVIENLKP